MRPLIRVIRGLKIPVDSVNSHGRVLVTLAAFVIGSWGPSADLRKLRDEAREERSDRGKRKSARKNSSLGSFAQLVRIPDEPSETPASTNAAPAGRA